MADPKNPGAYPEAFRRLYWIAYIYEGDFMSEISVTLPSGIARFEDSVPYPTHAITPDRDWTRVGNGTGLSATSCRRHVKDDLVAFQISTNAAIRRLLNRVHSMVYDSKDRFRMTRIEYVGWLLRVTKDFTAYHDTIYSNAPEFLFTSMLSRVGTSQTYPCSCSDCTNANNLANDPWNVLRLRGRYCAAQHIIHRPFIDYVLLNMDSIDTHPDKDAIMEKCGLCLDGCKNFFSVFDIEEANSTTGLFATGMA